MTDKKKAELLKQAIDEEVITCPECGNHLEVDAEKCYCGWENILRKEGFV